MKCRSTACTPPPNPPLTENTHEFSASLGKEGLAVTARNPHGNNKKRYFTRALLAFLFFIGHGAGDDRHNRRTFEGTSVERRVAGFA